MQATLTLSLGMQHLTGAHTDGKYFAIQVVGGGGLFACASVCACARVVCVRQCRMCVCVCVCVCVLVPCVCVCEYTRTASYHRHYYNIY